MAKKGLDITFVHYGIRKDDMQLLETLSRNFDLDFEWLKEDILKEHYDRRIKNEDLGEKELSKLIDKALQKIKA